MTCIKKRCKFMGLLYSNLFVMESRPLKGSIFINVKDIQEIESIRYLAAWKRLKKIKETYQKTKATVQDYCSFFKVDYLLVVEKINKIR